MTGARARLVAALLAVVLVGIGAAVGVAVDRLWFGPDNTPADVGLSAGPPPRASVDRQLNRFRRRLNLDAAQTEQIRGVLESARDEIQRIHAPSREAAEEVRERSQKQILDILTPEQADEYREMMERRGRRRGSQGKRRPGKGPRGQGRGAPPH